MKKPRTIVLAKNRAKGVEADVSPSIAEGWFWTYDPKELRRLARWCEEAATYLEKHGDKAP